MNKRNFLNLALIFLVFWLLFDVFNKKSVEEAPPKGEFVIQTTRNEFKQGKPVAITLFNNSEHTVTLPGECPGEPFTIVYLGGTGEEKREASPEISCEEAGDIVLESGAKKSVEYTYWSNALFDDTGRYRIEADVALGDLTRVIRSNEFTVTQRGAFGKFWITAIYQPIYNVLIALINWAPGKNLAFAIILLTIIIRLILLIPSQRAMVAQRKMQEIQPQLDKIRKQYAGNQERIAQETMTIWKEHKVNPLGSCLPILIQFPILIALFYVIRSGLNPDNAILLYESLADFKFGDIDPHFLGMDLTKLNTIVLPLIVGGLQFAQMKLAEAKNEKHGKKEKKQDKKPAGNEMQMATKMMTYVMPVMIAVFTASIPAGVGVYWGTSTIFGIGQQLIVNKKFKKTA